MLINASLAS